MDLDDRATEVWWELMNELRFNGQTLDNQRVQDFVEALLAHWQRHIVAPNEDTRVQLAHALDEADAAMALLALQRRGMRAVAAKRSHEDEDEAAALAVHTLKRRRAV